MDRNEVMRLARESTATTGVESAALTLDTLRDAIARMKALSMQAPPAPRIVESLLMVEDGKPYAERRTWKERLFTRPWRPLMAERTVVPKAPRKDAIRLPDGTLVMHPAMASQMREAIRARGKQEKV